MIPKGHKRAVIFSGAYRSIAPKGRVMGLHPKPIEGRDKKESRPLSKRPKWPLELLQAAAQLGMSAAELNTAIRNLKP